MIILADNDIILKLAQCDLLECLPYIVEKQPYEILVTPAAKYQLLPKHADKRLRKCGNEETLTRLTDFLKTTQTLDEVQDTELLAKLDEFEGIDGGEKFLFAAAVEKPSPFLITGDRRALRALLKHQNNFPTVYAALKDKVITFESVILLAIHHLGFAVIKQKIIGSPKLDGVLQMACSGNARETDFTECLVSYSKEVMPLLAFKQRLSSELNQS